ncbi:izumo sperm-egg fusion protein 4 isoform X1 [Loxodonta africana]|uniref:izumo sperm-egg fusion protein 4 isoform X1 n=1 Tax=Loxodonta africana TaxID=9785 RepID=UPI000C812AE7|nr:izumo sperm-egg fusion protein 4 isoform X1 [Loxodonta africana]XP_023397041.1 izumo sperm-egg fusion protein 4 isoform X1 [Loxodonta africana]
MALLLCLGMTAALARGCLHCHGNFSDKFSFYRHHVNLKSWWVGDIPVSGALLTDWSQDTMNELHLAIPAEITEEKLDQVANAVYQRLDQLYQGKMYFPGYFPNELRAIFREQVHLIQNAIIERLLKPMPGAPGPVHCGGPTPTPDPGAPAPGGGQPGPAEGPVGTHCPLVLPQAASTVSDTVVSSSMRPSPATTALTPTLFASATTASRRHSGSGPCRASLGT